MNNCIKCNHKFKFKDRLKVFTNWRGDLKCPECNTLYRGQPNIYRGIYVFAIFYIFFTYINPRIEGHLLLKIISYVLLILLFEVLPHNFHKYTMIEK